MISAEQFFYIVVRLCALSYFELEIFLFWNLDTENLK